MYVATRTCEKPLLSAFPSAISARRQWAEDDRGKHGVFRADESDIDPVYWISERKEGRTRTKGSAMVEGGDGSGLTLDVSRWSHSHGYHAVRTRERLAFCNCVCTGETMPRTRTTVGWFKCCHMQHLPMQTHHSRLTNTPTDGGRDAFNSYNLL